MQTLPWFAARRSGGLIAASCAAGSPRDDFERCHAWDRERAAATTSPGDLTGDTVQAGSQAKLEVVQSWSG